MRFDEMPSVVPGMRGWGANVGRYHFVITHEDGTRLRPDDRAAWTGYTASWKSFEGRHGRPVMIEGRWDNFTDAERACRETWRQLRNKQ